MKVCKECNQIKPLSEFYKHKEMRDGHLNICKECKRRYAKAYRLENLEKVRAYDRNRPNAKERAEKYKKKLKWLRDNDPDKYKQYLLRKKQWSKKNRSKRNAHTKLRRAIKKGLLTKPSRCQECGQDGIIQAHHPDYLRPLDVMWLCVKCHANIHKKERELKRAANEY